MVRIRNMQNRGLIFIPVSLIFVFLISANCQKNTTGTTSQPESAAQGQTHAAANTPAKDQPTNAVPAPTQPGTEEGANAEGTPDNGPPAKAVFAETSFNAGEIQQGDDLKHIFIVKNTGPGVLRIISAKPS